MGVVGYVELGGGRGETGIWILLGRDVETEVIAGGDCVFVGVLVVGGLEVEGGFEELLGGGRVWDEVARVELGGEDARCAVYVEVVVGMVADFIDVSGKKRARGGDELTTTVTVGVGKLGAEDGGVEAGAVVAGLGAVVDDHGGEGGVDVAGSRGDHARKRANSIPPREGVSCSRPLMKSILTCLIRRPR